MLTIIFCLSIGRAVVHDIEQTVCKERKAKAQVGKERQL